MNEDRPKRIRRPVIASHLENKSLLYYFPCHNAVYELLQSLSFQVRRPGSLPWQEEEEDIYGMGKVLSVLRHPGYQTYHDRADIKYFLRQDC